MTMTYDMWKAHNPADDKPEEVACPRCQGQGVVKKWHGDHLPDRDCKECDGTGALTQAQAEAYHERQKP